VCVSRATYRASYERTADSKLWPRTPTALSDAEMRSAPLPGYLAYVVSTVRKTVSSKW
jgi:hypothetical protein